MLCKYSNIFGKPNEGVHSIKLFNIALVDLGLTILLGYLIYLILNKYLKVKIKLLLIFLILFLLSIIFHRLFCVRTTIDKLLFY
jgi:hypothetical protein